MMNNVKIVAMMVVLAVSGAGCGGCTPPNATVPETVAGSCNYTSRFNNDAPECKEFLGSEWTLEDMTESCGEVNAPLLEGVGCALPDTIGKCVLGGGTERVTRLSATGTGTADNCVSNQRGCEVFGGGVWVAEEVCGGVSPDDNGDTGLPPFIQPYLQCSEPVTGEDDGNGPDGTVCTWQSTQGCTEEGRYFSDYASCDVVYTQRPATPIPGNDIPLDDPRLADPAFVTELDWVRKQIDSCSCVCCHTNVAPDGPSMWTTDSPGAWINTFYDTGLAFGAGYVDSTSFGAFKPEDNNGFIRSVSGFASTDPARMQAFFANELTHRGKTEADFVNERPFGGPLYDQMFYSPTACTGGEGVAADGVMTWTGGRARYVYVLEEGGMMPTIPPGLDVPEGTLWRLDVVAGDAPLRSGEVRYGVADERLVQRIPADGSVPPTLVSGRSYVLYVTVDVAIPITRCVFTAP
jgi:hypothetical protein